MKKNLPSIPAIFFTHTSTLSILSLIQEEILPLFLFPFPLSLFFPLLARRREIRHGLPSLSPFSSVSWRRRGGGGGRLFLQRAFYFQGEGELRNDENNFLRCTHKRGKKKRGSERGKGGTFEIRDCCSTLSKRGGGPSKSVAAAATRPTPEAVKKEEGEERGNCRSKRKGGKESATQKKLVRKEEEEKEGGALKSHRGGHTSFFYSFFSFLLPLRRIPG